MKHPPTLELSPYEVLLLATATAARTPPPIRPNRRKKPILEVNFLRAPIRRRLLSLTLRKG